MIPSIQGVGHPSMADSLAPFTCGRITPVRIAPVHPRSVISSDATIGIAGRYSGIAGRYHWYRWALPLVSPGATSSKKGLIKPVSRSSNWLCTAAAVGGSGLVGLARFAFGGPGAPRLAPLSRSPIPYPGIDHV